MAVIASAVALSDLKPEASAPSHGSSADDVDQKVSQTGQKSFDVVMVRPIGAMSMCCDETVMYTGNFKSDSTPFLLDMT